MSATLNLPAVVTDTFQCKPELDAARLVLRFAGNGDMDAMGLLADFLMQVHEEAMRVGVAEVICDLQKLLFMNSSCFKSFVVWIDTVKNSAVRYQIAFQTNPNLHWQRRSLEALRRLAANIVTIETIA